MISFCPRCATPVEDRLFEGRPRPTCPACAYIAFSDPKVAAAVLVERDGQVLLIRRAIDPGKGLWCFPGGYVDFAEDPVVAATRECREETGLDVADLRLLDVAFNGRVIVITYATTTFAGDPAPGDDADRVSWFAADNLPPLAFGTMEQAIGRWKRGGRETRD
jgi:8-oxo-dGTP diphosphatase